MAKFRTHYDNLKVARNAPDAVIRAAYKALMQQYHPDKFKGSEEEALRIAKIIQRSYEVLTDPIKRAEHDAWIAQQEQQEEAFEWRDVETPAREESPPPSPPPEPRRRDEDRPAIHPWRRLFARVTDYTLSALLLVFVLRKSEETVRLLSNPLLLAVPNSFFWIFIEAMFMSIFGETPGKTLFGLRLVSEANPPRDLGRAFAVWWRGVACGLPFFGWITAGYAYYKLSQSGRTSWDRDYGFRVEARNVNLGRVLLIGGAWAGLFLAMVGSDIDNRRGYVAEDRRQYSETATAVSENGYKTNENAALAALNQGWSYQKSGRLQEAISSYREALRLKPDLAEAWYNLGNTYKSIGQRPDAISSYREVIRLKPDLAEAWHNLGAAYAEIGQFGDAVNCLSKAITLDPDNAEAWYDLGVVYGDTGQQNDAIKNYRKAVSLKPNLADAWNNLGTSYVRTGQWSDAITSLRKAISLNQDDAFVWYNLGIVYAKTGKSHDAINSYREAIRLNPDYAEAWHDLGVSYVSTEEWNQAINSFRQAVSLKPDIEDAWYSLGLVYMQVGDQAQALEAIKQLRRYSPAKADTLFNILYRR